MKRNSESKNFAWNTIGLTFYSFVSLALLIIVKRINGIDTAGIFTYAFSLSTLFFYVALYYSRVYQIANYDGNKNFNQFVSMRILTCIASLIIIVIFSIISGFSFEKIAIIALLMLFRIIDALSDTFYGYLQERGNLYRSGISYTLKSLIGFFAFTIIDYITKNLYLSIMTLVLVNAILLIFYDYRNYKIISSNTKLKFDFSNNKLILKEAFPIFIFSFLSIYLANSQKYVLTYYAKESLQTIFGIIIMPATVLSLIGNYLIIPFVDKLNKCYKEKDIDRFYSISYKILLILFGTGIIGTIAAYFLGIPVLNLIYDVKIDKYLGLLVLIIVASTMVAMSMIISNLLIILKKNSIQLKMYVVISILATILNVVLIKKFSIDGAVFSYMIVYLIMLITYLIVFITYRKRLGEVNEKK